MDPFKLVTADGSFPVDVRLLEELFDQMHDTAFFIKDVKGCYVVVNDSLVERHGMQGKSQVIGRRPCDICPGDFGRIPAEQDAQVLRSGRPIIDRLELQWRAPCKPVWCLTTKLLMRDARGAITGIIGISKDVRTPLPTREIPAEIAVALRRLETGYHDPISPSELARVAGLPAARFARIIKRIFGISPMQLISKTRIAAATRFLRDSDESVAAIALRCGFTDHSAFTRTFRSITGITPSEFRKRNHDPAGATPSSGGS